MGKPPKSDVLGNLKWDYLEDMLRMFCERIRIVSNVRDTLFSLQLCPFSPGVSIASYPLAYAMCYARGSVTGGSLVWTMPAWANRLLYQAVCPLRYVFRVRRFAPCSTRSWWYDGTEMCAYRIPSQVTP